MSLDPKKTAVIFLGSETFQSASYENSSAFSEAKKRIFSYFSINVNIPSINILDLFDSSIGADDQDKAISTFILQKKESGIQDLFIYYVGHGGFTPTENTFYLALKNTRNENPAISSLTIKALAHTITTNANLFRTFIILDCCFAAAAGMAFMADENLAPAVQMKDAFPSKGVAMLCASSKDAPAMIVKERNITMFTEGLQLALTNGDQKINEKLLSLRQILELTNSYIKEKNPGNAVRSELASPIQTHGDIADNYIFENFAYKESRFDMKAKKDNIIKEMTSNNFISLGNLLLDFVREFDEFEILLTDAILLSSECNELLEDKEKISYENYNSRKKELYIQIIKMINQVVDSLKSKAT